MTSIEIRDLTLARGSDFTLGPLSLEIESGSQIALVGPSGCGKTTLLRCLAGLETPDAGVIRFGDRTVFEGSNRVAPSARRIGFVFQDGALWPHLTAAQHLEFVAPERTRGEIESRLDAVGLGGRVNQRPAELSGGEAQRLALARALAGDPEVLLLDEPLNSVDVALRSELAVLIRRVCAERGLTSIVVTHDRDEALALADEIAVLHDGALVESGSARGILREPRTAFAATFFARGVRLPVRQDADGSAVTPFGRVAETQAERLAPIVLPGDVVVSSNGSGAPARVVQVVPGPVGATAVVDLDGCTLRVACDEAVEPGDTLMLELRGELRFLGGAS